MLTALRIKDFAAIESITIEFGSGLNVLTGDAGVARSVIVDALGAAFGARVGAEQIRARATSATVEARCALDADGPAARWLREQGFGGRDLVVTREATPDGRARAWINGREVTVDALRALGDMVVEGAGQHEGLGLFHASVQRDLLDAFGGPALETLRTEITERMAARAVLRTEQQALKEAERDRQRKIEALTQQIREIDAAAPQPDEETALEGRRTRLLNAERLAEAARGAYTALTDAEGQATVDQFGRAKAVLGDAAAIDSQLGKVAERLDALAGGLAEIADELARYVTTVEARPGELAAIEYRLDLLRGLRQKYGQGVDAVLKFRGEAATALAQFQGSETRGPQIASALAGLDRELADRCERLTVLRQETAARFAADVAHQLATLDMGRMRLVVAFARDPDQDGLSMGDQHIAVGPTGADRVEFHIAGAAGEDPRPLERIASSGERSRVVLAIRHVLASIGGVPVLVCDDIDAGMGARTVRALGQILDAVARTRQVLCVIQLPQIACLGDRHIWVGKDTAGGRPRIQMQALGPKERVEEIARMLSGRMPAPIAREYAAELLGRARHQTGAGAVTTREPRGGGA